MSSFDGVEVRSHNGCCTCSPASERCQRGVRAADSSTRHFESQYTQASLLARTWPYRAVTAAVELAQRTCLYCHNSIICTRQPRSRAKRKVNARARKNNAIALVKKIALLSKLSEQTASLVAIVKSFDSVLDAHIF